METTYAVSYEVRSRAGRKLDWDTFNLTTAQPVTAENMQEVERAARSRVSLKGSEYVVVTGVERA